MTDKDKAIELVEYIDTHLNTTENSQVYYELEDIINQLLALLKCPVCGGKSKTLDRGHCLSNQLLKGIVRSYTNDSCKQTKG